MAAVSVKRSIISANNWNTGIRIGDSMISSDIRNKYREWYF